MALWSDRRLGFRRLRALITNLPPNSVTALLMTREGSSSTPAPAPRRLRSVRDLTDLGVEVGVHHG